LYKEQSKFKPILTEYRHITEQHKEIYTSIHEEELLYVAIEGNTSLRVKQLKVIVHTVLWSHSNVMTVEIWSGPSKLMQISPPSYLSFNLSFSKYGPFPTSPMLVKLKHRFGPVLTVILNMEQLETTADYNTSDCTYENRKGRFLSLWFQEQNKWLWDCKKNSVFTLHITPEPHTLKTLLF
jgi:hypothetical protein